MDSAWQKWARAMEHQRELAADVRTYTLNDGAHEYVRFDNLQDRSASRIKMYWVLRVRTPYPSRWSVLVGDVVTNLRAALDQAFWYAATRHGPPPNPTQVLFPLCGSEKEWRKRLPLADVVGPDVWTIIDAEQPFRLGDHAADAPLEVLRWLSNADKHRHLHIVSHTALAGDAIPYDSPVPLEGVESWYLDGEAKDGDVVARLRFQRPSEDATATVRPSFAHIPTLRVGDKPRALTLAGVMQQPCDAVLHVLIAMSTCLSVSLPKEALELGERYNSIAPEGAGDVLILHRQDAEGRPVRETRRLDLTEQPEDASPPQST